MPMRGQDTYVSVFGVDGSLTEMSVGADGELSFDDDGMTVSSGYFGDVIYHWQYDEVDRVLFFHGHVGIDETHPTPQLKLFPTPTRQSFALVGLGSEPQQVQLFNVAGQPVMTMVCADGDKVDVSRLNAGVYFVRIGCQTLKFVKQ